MKLGYNPRYRVWLDQAKYDLHAAINSSNSGFHEWACFISEQSAEKTFKAIIVANNQIAPRIHKLNALVNIAKKADDRFRPIYFEVKELSVFTFIARYPFLIPGEVSAPHQYITLNDANICITKATTILNTVESLLND